MRMTVSRKLGGLVAFAALLFVALSVLQVAKLREVMRQDSQALVRAQTEGATSIVRSFVNAANAGEMSVEEAQESAAAALSAIRYGNDDYFFVNDSDAIIVVHPNSELIGTSQWEKRDPAGVPLFQELIERAKEGGGYTSYLWPRAGAEQPIPKLSYSSIVPEWDWVVGTGVYLEDLEAAFAPQLRQEVMSVVVKLVVVLGMLAASGWFISRSIARPLTSMTQIMVQLADGDLSVEVAETKQRDEVGLLSTSARRMIGSLREMSRAAESIAAGDLRADVTPRSDDDRLGIALRDMVIKLREVI
ncbi:cache domain-containing protein, partial [Palleronia marisminoris]